MRLNNSTTNASLLIISGKLLMRAMDIVVLMVLTRILTPTDFGIIAMAKTAILILEAVTELPIASALVRQEKLTDAMFNTALTLGILRGLLITLIVFAISFPLASFYKEPHVAYLMMAMAFGPFFRGVVSPKIVLLMKQMDFKKQVIQECIGKSIALVFSIAYAITYKDYWALVILIVAAPALTSIISFILIPMRYQPTLSEWEIFKDIIGWNFINQVFAAINWQLEKILLPAFINNRKFGFYSIYGDLVSLAYQTVVVPISSPVSVSFQNAKINNNLKQTYNLTLNVTFTLIAPIYGFIACFPEKTIIIFFGNTWLDYSYVLQYISLIAIVSISSMLIAPLANILYQNKALTIRVLIEFVINLPTTFFAVKYYGINGAVAARMVSSLVIACTSIFMTKKFISAGFYDFFTQLLRPVFALLITHIVLYFLQFKLSMVLNASLYLNFILLIALYLVVYFFTLMILWMLFGKKEGFESLLIEQLNLIINKK